MSNKLVDIERLSRFWTKVNDKKQDKLTSTTNIEVNNITTNGVINTKNNKDLVLQPNGTGKAMYNDKEIATKSQGIIDSSTKQTKTVATDSASGVVYNEVAPFAQITQWGGYSRKCRQLLNVTGEAKQNIDVTDTSYYNTILDTYLAVELKANTKYTIAIKSNIAFNSRMQIKSGNWYNFGAMTSVDKGGYYIFYKTFTPTVNLVKDAGCFIQSTTAGSYVISDYILYEGAYNENISYEPYTDKLLDGKVDRFDSSGKHYPIPQDIQDLPDYGIGLFEMPNTVFAVPKTYHNMKSVDLGSLNWSYDTANKRFQTSINDIKQVYPNTYTLCQRYASLPWTQVTTMDKGIFQNGVVVAIKDSRFSDVNTFANSVRGVILHYEATNGGSDYDAKLYYRLVGSVDLGGLNWSYNSDTGSFQFVATLPSALINHNTLSDRYVEYADWVQFRDASDKSTFCENATIRIKDSNYTNAQAFKAAMQGVMLYYQLATEEVYDITDILPDDFGIIEVEGGGTVEFHYPALDDGYVVDMPSTIYYETASDLGTLKAELLERKSSGSNVTEQTVANWGFTKNKGTITGIKMNGATKGTDGVVDLGTVVTDVSDKQDAGYYMTSREVYGTIDDLYDEIKGTPGGGGSISLVKKDNGIGSEIVSGWYNFFYSPHRTGVGMDNDQYATILLTPMTFSGDSYIIRVAGSVVAEVKRLDDTNTWRPCNDNLTSDSTIESLSANQGKILNETKMGTYWAYGIAAMTEPSGRTDAWIRTPDPGLLPREPGNIAGGHSSLGLSDWRFEQAYIDYVYTNKTAIGDKVTMQYNSNTESLEFIFV